MEGVNCLTLLADGKREGLGCLYKLFAKDLYRYGLSICGNENEVEECIHDFFVFLWDYRLKLVNISNPKAYLFISFKRRLVKQLGSQKNIDAIDIKYEQQYHDESIEDAIINREDENEYLDKLSFAMKNLSDREREVVHLKYYEKHSNEEIAKLLDINYQSVRNLLYRAIQNLRKNL